MWALDNGLGLTPAMGYSSWNDCSSMRDNGPDVRANCKALCACVVVTFFLLFFRAGVGIQRSISRTSQNTSSPQDLPS